MRGQGVFRLLARTQSSYGPPTREKIILGCNTIIVILVTASGVPSSLSEWWHHYPLCHTLDHAVSGISGELNDISLFGASGPPGRGCCVWFFCVRAVRATAQHVCQNVTKLIARPPTHPGLFGPVPPPPGPSSKTLCPSTPLLRGLSNPGPPRRLKRHTYSYFDVEVVVIWRCSFSLEADGSPGRQCLGRRPVAGPRPSSWKRKKVLSANPPSPLSSSPLVGSSRGPGHVSTLYVRVCMYVIHT